MPLSEWIQVSERVSEFRRLIRALFDADSHSTIITIANVSTGALANVDGAQQQVKSLSRLRGVHCWSHATQVLMWCNALAGNLQLVRFIFIGKLNCLACQTSGTGKMVCFLCCQYFVRFFCHMFATLFSGII